MSQTRRTIVAVVASVAVFYLWMLIAVRIWPPPKPPPPATQPAAPVTQPVPATSTAPATHAAGTQPAIGPSGEGYAIAGGESTGAITIGSAAAGNPYPMSVELLPRGAAIGEVRLRGHYETVKREKPYLLLEKVKTASGRALASFETSKLRFEDLKIDVPLGDVIWTLSPESTDGRKVFTVEVKGADGAPLARVIKTYELNDQPLRDKLPETFDLHLSLRLENLSGRPLNVIVVQQGPLGLLQEEQRSEDRRVVAATWSDNEIIVSGHVLSSVQEKGRIDLGGDTGETRIAWAANTNKYFAAIMTPAGRKGSGDPAVFAGLEAVDLGESDGNARPEASESTFQYVTLPRSLPAGGAEELNFDLYLGPKSKRAFETVPEYQRLGYYWVIRESFYACAPAGLTSLMMRLLGFFYRIPPHNYGLAIIMLVLLVRTILHPITKRSQVNMMKMQKQMSALQPKIEAVKQKYANDPTQRNQAMMEVYREAGINPAGQFLSCLPLMLQIPIWGALWAALSSTIEMRHAPFDGFWIRDLAGQDAVYTFPHPIHIPLISYLMGGPFYSLNVLPLLLALSQFLQAKYMPHTSAAPRSGQQADQMAQQRKMMMYMSFVFILFFYNAPAGLNLYIMASNLFGILEQWRIRKHLAEVDRKAQLAPAAGAAAGGAAAPSVPRAPAKPREPSWLERKWQELQKQAEEAKKVQSQRNKKGKPRR